MTFTSFRRFAGGQGWGVTTGGQISQTADGGRVWHPAGQMGSTAFFLSSRDAWVADLVPGKQLTVRHTADGGATWSALAPVPVGFGDGGMHLSFADAEAGWMQVLGAEGDTWSDQQVCSTDAAGQTWHPAFDGRLGGRFGGVTTVDAQAALAVGAQAPTAGRVTMN